MGLCVLYYVEYSLYDVKKVGFFLSGLELHFKIIVWHQPIVASFPFSFISSWSSDNVPFLVTGQNIFQNTCTLLS